MGDYILRCVSDSNSLSHHGVLGQRKGKITSFVGKYYVPKGTRKKMAAAKEAIKKERAKDSGFIDYSKRKRTPEQEERVRKFQEQLKREEKEAREERRKDMDRAIELERIRLEREKLRSSEREKDDGSETLFGKQAVKSPKLNSDRQGLKSHKKETLRQPSEESEKKNNKNKNKKANSEKKQTEEKTEDSNDKPTNWRDKAKNKVAEQFADSKSEKLKKKQIGKLTDDELEYLRKRTNSEKNLKNNLKELNKSEKPEKSSEDLVKAATDMRRAFKDISQDVQKNPPMTNPKRLKLSKYSDAELKSMISDAKKRTERMQLEDEYNSLVNSPRVNTGAVKAASALATVGTLAVVGTQVANFVITAKKMSN